MAHKNTTVKQRLLNELNSALGVAPSWRRQRHSTMTRRPATEADREHFAALKKRQGPSGE